MDVIPSDTSLCAFAGLKQERDARLHEVCEIQLRIQRPGKVPGENIKIFLRTYFIGVGRKPPHPTATGSAYEMPHRLLYHNEQFSMLRSASLGA